MSNFEDAGDDGYKLVRDFAAELADNTIVREVILRMIKITLMPFWPWRGDYAVVQTG